MAALHRVFKTLTRSWRIVRMEWFWCRMSVFFLASRLGETTRRMMYSKAAFKRFYAVQFSQSLSGMYLGPLHMIPVDRAGPVTEISAHSNFLCKIFDVFIWEGGPAPLPISRFLQPRYRQPGRKFSHMNTPARPPWRNFFWENSFPFVTGRSKWHHFALYLFPLQKYAN